MFERPFRRLTEIRSTRYRENPRSISWGISALLSRSWFAFLCTVIVATRAESDVLSISSNIRARHIP